MVYGTRASKPEPRFPDFEGAPTGWAKWPRHRQQKYLEQHPGIGAALSKAITERGMVTSAPTATPVTEVPETVSASAHPAGVTMVSGVGHDVGQAVGEITNIRQWNEAVDGISAERIRNCIIYQLDYKKSKFYRDALTEGFIKRTLGKLGVTGARKLHEDTPPGWTRPDPDPLKKIKYVVEDGKEVEKCEYRSPKTVEERARLLKVAFTSRSKIIPYFVPLLVDPNCPQCKGTGYQDVLLYPDSKIHGHLKKSVLCECVTNVSLPNPA